MPDSSSTYGRISFAPSAQLIPTERSGACETEFQNASTIWPESVRPDLSVIVTETMSGTRRAPSSKSCCAAKRAALRTSVSKTVSKRRTSAPPSSSPRTWSRYAAAISAKTCVRFPGSFTSTARESVRFVGPSGARDERVPSRFGAVRVDGLPREARGRGVQLVGERLEAVVREGDRLRVERVRLDDVRAGGEVGAVDPLDDRGLREDEEVVRALEVLRVGAEALAAVPGLVETLPLDHRPHRAVDDGDAAGEERAKARLGAHESASRIRFTTP